MVVKSSHQPRLHGGYLWQRSSAKVHGHFVSTVHSFPENSKTSKQILESPLTLKRQRRTTKQVACLYRRHSLSASNGACKISFRVPSPHQYSLYQ
jgi:hypothetical protein